MDLFVVAGFRKDGQRNELRRIIRLLEPTIGEDYANIAPSSISLQFVGEIQSLRDSDDIHIVVRPDFSITCDGNRPAFCEEPKILDWFKWTQIVFDAGVVLKNFKALLIPDNIEGVINF